MSHTSGLLRILLRWIEFWLIYFPSSDAHMGRQQIQSSRCLLLTWSSQHNVISIVNQCDILWEKQMIKIPLN